MTGGIGTTSYGYYTVTNGQLGAGMLASVDGPFTKPDMEQSRLNRH